MGVQEYVFGKLINRYLEYVLDEQINSLYDDIY